MLLPTINKRAECTLKSSRADTLSCTWLFLHWCLLSSQKTKKNKKALLLLPKVRKRSCLHHSVCSRIDACFQTEERGEQTQRSGKGGSRTAVSLNDAPSSWVPSALASELWRRAWTEDWSLQHTLRYRGTGKHVACAVRTTFRSLISRYVQPFSQS